MVVRSLHMSISKLVMLQMRQGKTGKELRHALVDGPCGVSRRSQTINYYASIKEA